MTEHAWDLKVISYNLHEHRAHAELEQLTAEHRVDVLCLQECDTEKMPSRIGDLQVASMTATNRLGLAVYFRSDRFSMRDSKTFALRKSMHDRVMRPANERLLATRLKDHARDDDDVVVASFHAAPLTAGNSMRRSQMIGALDAMADMAPGAPRLMVGDYNYPLFARGLQRRMMQGGYAVTRSDRPTYVRYRYFRGHFDFATSDAMTIDRITTLPQGGSDHLPILIEARYGAAAAGAEVPLEEAS